MKDSPIFAKTYDLLLWLIPQTQRFPKSQRFVVAKRVQEAAFSFYELIIEARKVRPNRSVLLRADIELEKLRLYLRLCQDLTLLSFKQYEHGSRMMTEIGKMLGGWIKKGEQYESQAMAAQAAQSALL